MRIRLTRSRVLTPALSRCLVALVLGLFLSGSLEVGAQTGVRFAVIGDYGDASDRERDVANLVKSWNPDIIITTGDNNYNYGEASTIDRNIGQFYSEFIYPYKGVYGRGANYNRFFPSPGNHDWGNRVPNPSGLGPYLDYFTLPGNERYYDFIQGPVHFFALDSDLNEPDGVSQTSIQAEWLRSKLAASTSPWKIVYFHHPPYTSGRRQDTWMRWPYKQWGASAVLTGHDHNYERLSADGLPYFVNGLGARELHPFATPAPESLVRYNGDHGAMLVEASPASITFQFINRAGVVIDTYTLNASTPAPAPPASLPAPWMNQDIGSVGPAGGAAHTAGTFTVKGAGADVWGAADAFHYVYQPLAGDGEISARVTGLQHTHANAKAGVMIRETLAANSPHAIMNATPGAGLEFIRRLTSGGPTTYTGGGNASAPYWVKVVRRGDTFSGYKSSDGSSWVLVGTDTIKMAASVYIGLAVTSHDNVVLCTASLDNVTVSVSATPSPAPTLINDPEFFVSQHYRDFLNREPDAPGLAFWTNNITSCGSDARCIDIKRTDTSAAYFLSLEFQQTGYFVYRFYKAAFGQRPTFAQFLPDTQALGRGITGAAGLEQQIEANKQAYIREFIARPAFTQQYPGTLTASQYVDALNSNAGGVLTSAERDALVNGLQSGAETRASVLRKMAEDQDFFNREFNAAFVLMQYLGYLRRDPDAAGFDFWLGKLNRFGGDFRAAEMVKAFIVSQEYRARFERP